MLLNVQPLFIKMLSNEVDKHVLIGQATFEEQLILNLRKNKIFNA